MPSRVLGDFDSVSGQAMAWAQTLGAAMDRYNPDKDDTDFQLALKRAAGAVLVTGCKRLNSSLSLNQCNEQRDRKSVV